MGMTKTSIIPNSKGRMSNRAVFETKNFALKSTAFIGQNIRVKKAQGWSLDIALAAIIFISAFLIFFGIANSDLGRKFQEVSDEADYLVNLITSGNMALRLTDGNSINASKLEELMLTPYEQLKGQTGVKNDFCIYLEDDRGNIIPINDSLGIGSDTINVSGIPCG